VKIYEKDNPGPGTYKVLSLFGKEGPKFTKYHKKPVTKPKIVTDKGKNLGPGEYDINNKVTLNSDGKYSLSKFRNTSSVGWNQIKTESKKEKISADPGPGAYNISGLIDAKGLIFPSKFESALPKTFGRKLDFPVIKVNNLGPGQYKVFSEFGYPNQNFDFPEKENTLGKKSSNSLQSSLISTIKAKSTDV